MAVDKITKEKKQKNKSEKRTQLVAVMLVIFTVIGGTLAWQSFSQRVINETASDDSLIYEKGGRLHDYYNGTNKEVFVENFSSIGYGEDIYARIRLDEYYEYGEGAGSATADVANLNIVRGDKSNISNDQVPSINQLDTWDTYLWGSVANMDESIRTYRDFVFGGDTVYMPTFNKNYNSLDSEINGTYAGPDEDRTTDYDRYADYLEYEIGVESDELEAQYADPEDDAGYLLDVPAVHIAKSTLSATVISMSDWLNPPYNGEAGPYWVYDTDGWAYWAQPIKWQSATGLLLNKIQVIDEDAHSEWYYAVNVVAQIATAGDWGDEPEVDVTPGTGMYEGGFTDEAVSLLNKIAGITTE